MAVVVVEDERAHPEPGGRVCRGHQPGDGANLVAEVVGQVEGRVTHGLDRSRTLAPLGGALRCVLLDAEAKRAVLHVRTNSRPRVLQRISRISF